MFAALHVSPPVSAAAESRTDTDAAAAAASGGEQNLQSGAATLTKAAAASRARPFGAFSPIFRRRVTLWKLKLLYFNKWRSRLGQTTQCPPTFGRFALKPEKNICAKEGEKEILFFGGVKADCV